VDVGGTFTDLYLWDEVQGYAITHKVSSTPQDPSEAIISGLRELLSKASADPAAVGYLSHGTTVATNTILQQAGAKVGMLTTEGFRDLLEIGRQKRPSVFDLFADKPPVLVPRHLRKEIAERLAADGSVISRLPAEQVTEAVTELVAAGIEALAVCFLHSYANPDHERAAKEIAAQAYPGVYVSASHELTSEFREYERFLTAVLNSSLGPVLKDYMLHLRQALAELGLPSEPYIIQSNGGLLSIESAVLNPVRTVLSGPSAGAIGAAQVAKDAGFPHVITLDMGGTSTDVSLMRDNRPTIRSGQAIAGYQIRVPTVAIHTIGAGGGSIAWIDDAMGFHVGPRSAGARPGPACYGLGGTKPTVTDANVVLGRLNPEALLGGAMPISRGLSLKVITGLADTMGLPLERAASGVISVVVSNMVRAVRVISVERGEDPRDFALLAFGGAGPLHASAVARQLGIRHAIIPAAPGLLCAAGALLAEPRMEFSKTRVLDVGEDTAALRGEFEDLCSLGAAWLDHEGIEPGRRTLHRSTEMRYSGQNHELTVEVPAGPIDAGTLASLREGFHREHHKHFGYSSPAEPVQIITCRVAAIGSVLDVPLLRPAHTRDAAGLVANRSVYFDTVDSWLECPVYIRDSLAPQMRIGGPAVIEQTDSTTVLWPGDEARVDDYGNIVVTVEPERSLAWHLGRTSR
jgi:N-methylhydantoinase A